MRVKIGTSSFSHYFHHHYLEAFIIKIKNKNKNYNSSKGGCIVNLERQTDREGREACLFIFLLLLYCVCVSLFLFFFFFFFFFVVVVVAFACLTFLRVNGVVGV